MRPTGENPVHFVRIRDGHFGYADLSDVGGFLDGGVYYGLLSFGLGGLHGGSIDFHLLEPNPTLTIAIRRKGVFHTSVGAA
jgi:hypothetical protein